VYIAHWEAKNIQGVYLMEYMGTGASLDCDIEFAVFSLDYII
jgi:hypothetical protein